MKGLNGMSIMKIIMMTDLMIMIMMIMVMIIINIVSYYFHCHTR